MQDNGKRSIQKPLPNDLARAMGSDELAHLGDGEVAYIREITGGTARAMYPALRSALKDVPGDLELFAVHSADGTPIALTDSRRSALEHVAGENLSVATIH